MTATLAIRSAGQLIPASGVLADGASSTTAQLIGGWAAPGALRPIDSGTRWWWTLGADRAVSASFRPKRVRTVVASALAGDGDQVTPTPRGLVVTSLDGTTVTYDLTVDGRPAALRRTERALGGSAYDQSVRAFELSARVRAVAAWCCASARPALRRSPAG